MSLYSQELNSSQTTMNFISNYRPFHVVSKVKWTHFRQTSLNVDNTVKRSFHHLLKDTVNFLFIQMKEGNYSRVVLI